MNLTDRHQCVMCLTSPAAPSNGGLCPSCAPPLHVAMLPAYCKCCGCLTRYCICSCCCGKR